MTTEATNEDKGGDHWFTGKDLDVLLFRVNRRPRSQQTLFADRPGSSQPVDPLDHVAEVLTARPVSAESGRSYKRLWQVGNIVRTMDETVLIGRLGWARSGQTLSTVYDAESRQWVDREITGDRSAVSPFALIRDGRYLGILRNPTFNERTLAKVLSDLLNAGESERPNPTTDFLVEPIGDSEEFFAWVEQVDLLTRVEFVFRRPNPDAEEAFQELFERQAAYRADEIRETIRTTSSQEGLDKRALRTDRITQGFIAAAVAAFGFLTARGQRNGRPTKFDQRRSVARETVSNVGPSWDAATEAVVEATRRARRRRTDDG